MKIIEPTVELLTITKNPETLIELAGRTCYKSECKITDDSSAKFVRKIIKMGHLSVLEHASATFRIITDRGITHEIVRHRLASYSQESTRYCNYGKSDDLQFIQPPGLVENQRHQWKVACELAEASYLELLKFGCSPQIARSVLPNCLKTEIVMTANFREWMHFIDLRSAKAAHPQIRPLATSIQTILSVCAPNIFGEIK